MNSLFVHKFIRCCAVFDCSSDVKEKVNGKKNITFQKILDVKKSVSKPSDVIDTERRN